MTSRIGALGLFVLSLSACPPGGHDDAGVDLTVFVETRPLSAGPHGDGGFIDDAPPTYTSMKLFVGGDESQVITGTLTNGRITFENVPSADNVIELRSPNSQVPSLEVIARFETHHRALYFEYPQWARPDLANADGGTNLAFTITGLTPWAEGSDSFELFSAQAQFARGWYPDPQSPPPAQGDTTLSGVTLNTSVDMYSDDFRPLPAVVDSTKGDTLLMLQRRDTWTDTLDSVALSSWDPWGGSYDTRIVATANIASPNFSSADPVPVTAPFSPITPTALALDLHADTFAAARDELGMPVNARMTSYNSIYFEVGDGDTLYIGSQLNLWEHDSRSSQLIPENTECYPNLNDQCDAGCGPCDSPLTATYLAPGNVTLPVELTHPFSDPGTEMLSNDWRIYTTVNVPDAGLATLSAYNGIARPMPSSSPVVVERTLSAPRSLLLDGTAYPPSNAAVSTLTSATPTFSWTAPNLGTAKRYEVAVLDFQNTGLPFLLPYTVVRFVTTGTSVRVPEGALVSGHVYWFRVTAVDDPNDPDDARHVSRSGTYLRAEAVTGLVTVP